MRHRRSTNHLSRNAPHARSLLRNLAVSVLQHQAVTTTLGNAKAVQPMVERAITLGKAGDLHARRQAITLLGNPAVARRLFTELAPLFTSRQGGYTRIIRLGTRRGDGASLALLELTERIVIAPPAPKKRAAKTPPETPTEHKPKPAAPAKPSVAPAPAEGAKPSTKPHRLFDGLRKLWGRRQGQGDRGGSSR